MCRDGQVGQRGGSIVGMQQGRYGSPEDETDQAEVVRLANVDLYARRVSAGLPIFEKPAMDPIGGGD